MATEQSAVPNFCSFCEKSREQATKLIVSGSHAICDECVDLCNNLLIEQTNQESKRKNKTSKHTNPAKIKQFLDERVVGQDQAKIALCVGVSNHYKRLLYKSNLELDKSNILMLGPTGSGKTFLAKCVAKYLDVPFVIADATGLTEAGYVGDDVESIIARLVSAADGDVERAQQGIVFIDEIDKIGKKSDGMSSHRDVSGEGVQQALLKIVEGTTLNVTIDTGKRSPNQSTVQIDTNGILFVASGAFVGLQDLIQRRQRDHVIGFDSQTVVKPGLELIPEDLIRYGMIPEFVGRFSVTVQTNELTQKDMVQILTLPRSIIDQYKFYFEVDGIQVDFHEQALLAIAQRALDMKTGARALRSVLEQGLMPHLFALPKYKQQKVTQVLFTPEVFTKQADPIFTYKQAKKIAAK